MLLVDLAYHSDHMLEIGETYEKMLLDGKICQDPMTSMHPEVRMFSSVAGKLLGTTDKVNAAYWKANMVSPVQFCQAATELLKDTQLGADFLIELGPSGALSGPVSQIKKAISSEAPYAAALDRGSTQALFRTAGHLFIAGGEINLAKVNRIDKHDAKTIIDLPNYAWNHSTRYWHETRASKDWRFKKFVHHDLLGSKIAIEHLSLLPHSGNAGTIIDGLRKQQWVINSCHNPVEDVKGAEDVVLVTDELFDSVVDRFNEKQYETIKLLVERRCTVIWVTAGGQLEVTGPSKAAVVGLFRTIRAEEQVKLVTLDVESANGDATIPAISMVLDELCMPSQAAQGPTDSEFAERDGVVYVSRLLPDDALSTLQSDQLRTRPTVTEDLHASKAMVQLRAERLGDLDSVHFGEAATEAKALTPGTMEVKVVSAGLNYKDVVVGMPIVPGDETQMGHEAAGVVTQVAEDVSNFSVGDRVVVFGKGCFANRLHTTPKRAHRIPDDMSFEEAATLAVVYLTSMHSLFDLGGLSAGKKVLIHSAAGGVGIAAVQLARYAGAEVFVTVGSAEKRAYLKSTFGLEDKQIFNSRNTDFGKAIMTATGGRGVDIVLNSLTGDMLDESLRVLADGGVMVEIGKKVIIERNNLTMMPFDRNISFRAVDLSPELAPDALVARHLAKLYSGSDSIPASWKPYRQGRGADAKIDVPIRKAQQPLALRDDGCYLIVGELRGLCGSLAVYLAKSGARHLAVMSRSGYADDKSRGVLKQITALGAQIDLLTADVTKSEDVKRAFTETTDPIAGIVQGAMVLRDRPFDQMTFSEYHEAMACKIQGTWNLHNAAEDTGLKLDFFTLLSSISGVIGNRGQANHSAANVFLDAFACFRRREGLNACSVDLGVIEDAGVAHV
ncbi:hypothetical protein BST61_g3997 [Cercospora zeina]